jgi:hypothetical protein
VSYVRTTLGLIGGACAVAGLVLGIGVAASFADAYRSEVVPAERVAVDGTIRVEPVAGDQDTIDTGALVTWMTAPVCLLAGHNTMGWAWMDDLPAGTRVEVGGGPCAGTYEAYANREQGARGGPVPAWMRDEGLALVLQTCKTRGMGFTLLRRAHG